MVLEEEIDPNYVPGEEEVIEYAKWLGMDLVKDEDLYWIAREGLMVGGVHVVFCEIKVIVSYQRVFFSSLLPRASGTTAKELETL